MLEEILDVVDEKNEVVGTIERAVAMRGGVRIRSTVVMLFNADRSEVLLQLRSMEKAGYPGYWHVSAGGCVSTGERYDVAMEREIREEIGVHIGSGKLELLDTVLYENDGISSFMAVYDGVHEGPFVADGHEVERVEWVPIEKAREFCGDKIHPQLGYILDQFYQS